MNPHHTIAILAYNNHWLTCNNIEHLLRMGYKDNLFLFDNGSEPSFEQFARTWDIQYHREPENCYVNPAWNKIFDHNTSDYLTLLNNDCYLLSPDYFEAVLPHMRENAIGLSSCRTANITALKSTRLLPGEYFRSSRDSLKYFKYARRQGWLMTIDMHVYRTLDYHIPEYLRLWYGDDWIWGQFRMNDLHTAVYKHKYAVHVKNSTLSANALQTVVDADIKNLQKFGAWHKSISAKLHRRTSLLHRYA